MARPKAFDPDDALDAAVDLFWLRGYEATSISDLTEHLGLGRASLYGTFGSKDALYARALERYCDRHAEVWRERLESERPIRDVLHDVFMEMAERDVVDPERGCLLVNATVERSGDGATVERTGRKWRELEVIVADALERAQRRGEITAERGARELARFLLTFVQGLRVMGKARAGDAHVRDAIANALRCLD